MLNDKPPQIGLNPDENTLILIRRHWITLLPGLSIFIFAIILAAILLASAIQLTNSTITQGVLIKFSIIIFFIGFASISRTIIQWLYTVYQVTNDRIVLYTITRGLKSNVEEVVFDLVKGISQTRPSILASILNYGHIQLGTDNHYSYNSAFFMRYIPHPEAVLKLINTNALESLN